MVRDSAREVEANFWGKPYASIWRSDERHGIAVRKTEAHRTKEAAKRARDEADWMGNRMAAILAKKTALEKGTHPGACP